MDNKWAQRLKESRKNKKFLLKDVATKIKVSVQSLVQYESGAVKPKIDTFLLLCNLYGVNPNYILNGHEQNITDLNNIKEDLFMLALLQYQGKIIYLEDKKQIQIIDENFNNYLKYIAWYIQKQGLNSQAKMQTFINMIGKIDLNTIELNNINIQKIN